MVNVNEIAAYMFLADAREEVDIEAKWFENVPQAEFDIYNLSVKKKKQMA